MLERIGLGNAAVWWITIGSAATLFAASIAVPMWVVRIPADYFARARCSGAEKVRRYHGLQLVWLIAKNALGLAFFVLGALMLVLPGQGLLTLLIAAALLDFPGKFRLERWVISRRGVMHSLNWIRRKAGQDPFVLDP